VTRKKSTGNRITRTYRVHGRVQGVGFRYFVKQNADALGIRGYVRNEDDGSVFVFAMGDQEAINTLAGALRTGPRFSDVRSVEEKEASPLTYNSFVIES
jgi:acylphosphatase